MNRRLCATVAVLAASALTMAPAHAATKKKAKPKPIHGSYSVTMNPDPTNDVFHTAGKGSPTGGECGASSASVNKHPFKIPAAGTFHVVLDSANPLPVGTPLGPDWDLHILDADGSELDASTSETAHEETNDKFKKGQAVTIEVCNVTGQPNASVSYTFTYA